LIAVDDGSRDRSLEILKEYEKKYPSKIKVLSQKNQHVSAARNNGIKNSKGEYIAFLDHDDLWMPDKLEKQVRMLDKDKSTSLVYSNIQMIDSEEKVIEETTFYNIKPHEGNVFNELFDYCFIPVLTVLVRRSVLDSVGFFDTRFKIAEDYELFLRISEKYIIGYIPETLAAYRLHPENTSRDVEKGVREEFMIIDYWLEKYKKEALPLGKIKRKEAGLHIRLAGFYVTNLKVAKAAGEFLMMLKLFPYTISHIPKVVISIHHRLARRRKTSF